MPPIPEAAPLERRETAAALWQAIEGLPADLKTALLLRDVVGLSYTEIAEALEITQSMVKRRIFKAREALVLALRAEEAPETRDGPGRDRTCDLGIKSPLLYQLSYRPKTPMVEPKPAEAKTMLPR